MPWHNDCHASVRLRQSYGTSVSDLSHKARVECVKMVDVLLQIALKREREEASSCLRATIAPGREVTGLLSNFFRTPPERPR